MRRLIHLSDLHQQTDWRRRSWRSSGWRGIPGRFELHAMGRLDRFAGVDERIRRLVDAALGHEPDHVLITGDLTALGDQAEFLHVWELLQPLVETGRLTVIPGNHDRYTDTPTTRRFEQTFGALLASDLPEYALPGGYPFVKLVDERLALVGLDSTQVSGWSQYFVGRVGLEQLERLRRVLDDARVACRTALVMVHHGPLGPGGGFDWKESGLLDAAVLLEVLHERRAVLLHGHSHERSWLEARDGRPHLIGGGSSTESGREGYWSLTVDDHQRLEAVAHPMP